MSRNEEKHGIGFLGVLIPVVLLVVLVYSGYRFFQELSRYQEAENAYAEVTGELIVPAGDSTGETVFPEEEQRTEEPAEALPAGTEEAAVPAEEETGEEAAQAPSTEAEKTAKVPYRIDYEGLKQKNAEFVGVISLPEAGILYPMVQARDNSKYLTRLFTGEYNPSGAIFVDALAGSGFTDLNTIVFGHNMKNGSMFGSLKRFSQEEGLADGACIWIYTKEDGIEKARAYRIFAYGTVKSNTHAIYGDGVDFNEPEAYDAFLAAIRPITHGEAPAEGRPRLLTLSTCFGSKHIDNYIVVGAVVEE